MSQKKTIYTLPKKIPSKNAFQPKITHLYYQDKNLEQIPVLKSIYLEVLYLYSNNVKEIQNLENVPNLHSLYLQENQIAKIENLKNLKKLKKLHIGHNCITVLEGLEECKDLEEVHVEKQTIPFGDNFCFDPRTILNLSNSLQILDISHNKIMSLSYLSPLRYLRVINAGHNEIDDINDVLNVMRHWIYLSNATFIGNPLSKKHRYRESIIYNSYQLATLDGKTITESTRTFIKRFEDEKLLYGGKKSVNLAEVVPGLPKNYPHTLQKAVSASILKNKKDLAEDLSTFDEANAVYIPWRKISSRPMPKVRMPKLNINKPTRKQQCSSAVSVKKFP